MLQKFLIRVYCMVLNYLWEIEANTVEEAKDIAREKAIKYGHSNHIFVKEEKS